jgi:hypothetical protein
MKEFSSKLVWLTCAEFSSIRISYQPRQSINGLRYWIKQPPCASLHVGLVYEAYEWTWLSTSDSPNKKVAKGQQFKRLLSINGISCNKGQWCRRNVVQSVGTCKFQLQLVRPPGFNIVHAAENSGLWNACTGPHWFMNFLFTWVFSVPRPFNPALNPFSIFILIYRRFAFLSAALPQCTKTSRLISWNVLHKFLPAWTHSLGNYRSSAVHGLTSVSSFIWLTAIT